MSFGDCEVEDHFLVYFMAFLHYIFDVKVFLKQFCFALWKHLLVVAFELLLFVSVYVSDFIY